MWWDTVMLQREQEYGVGNRYSLMKPVDQKDGDLCWEDAAMVLRGE